MYFWFWIYHTYSYFDGYGWKNACGEHAFILGIDRFMSETRVFVNHIWNGMAAIVISRWEGEISKKNLRANIDKLIIENKSVAKIFT
ncbi:MAG: hypothetical protein ACRCR9_06275 [Chitinophagaceae bacterium]